MDQPLSKPRTKIHWWILRGLLEVLHVLLLITGVVAPFVLFIVVLIACIIGVVKGSLSLLSAVPAFLVALVSFFALGGLLFIVLVGLVALLQRVLPPEYRPSNTKKAHTDPLSPTEEEGSLMAEAPVQCPDPQCGAFLDRHAGIRLSIDPQTGKTVYPNASYAGGIRLLGIGLCFLFWIGAGGVVAILSSGSSTLSPAATTIGAYGFLGGIAMYVAGLWISLRRQKAALLRATSVISYQCTRCGKWWMMKTDDHSIISF